MTHAAAVAVSGYTCFFLGFKAHFSRPGNACALILDVNSPSFWDYFYTYAEGWTWLDALNFCVVTLATVGYGDITPTTPMARLFTIFYVLIGINFFIAFVNLLAKKRLLIFGHRTGDTDDDINRLQGEI